VKSENAWKIVGFVSGWFLLTLMFISLGAESNMSEDAADVLINLSALSSAACIGLAGAVWHVVVSEKEVPRG
jgi:hypothetical protein